MNMQKLLYVISQAPYSNSSGQEALEAILIGASFEQSVSVLFLHDGVFQLKSSRSIKSNLNLKVYTKTFKALSDFGVDECFVLANSLDARGLSISELMIEPTLLNEQQVSDLVAAQHRVFTF